MVHRIASLFTLVRFFTPSCRRSGQREAQDPARLGVDGLDRLLAADAAIALRETRAVILDDRHGVLVKQVLAQLDDFGGVVGSALEASAVVVAGFVVPGRARLEVVGRPAEWTDAPAGHPRDCLGTTHGDL